MKMDMSKAYNHVELIYLSWIILQMAFYVRCVDLVMRCVETLHFYNFFSGSLMRGFELERVVQ